MTKEELIKRMGNEDRADWVMTQVLASVKPDFIKLMLRVKMEEAEKVLKEREASNYYMNGTTFPEDFNYFSYSRAIEEGKDDGSKAAVIELYDLWEDRQYEHESDKMTRNFYSNMYMHFVCG